MLFKLIYVYVTQEPKYKDFVWEYTVTLLTQKSELFFNTPNLHRFFNYLYVVSFHLIHQGLVYERLAKIHNTCLDDICHGSTF